MYKIALLMLIAVTLQSKHIHKERYYQEYFCKNGIMEYGLPDRTRIDCLTDTHAIEVDFASKKFKAIGQSLYYAHMTRKTAGVVLIMEEKKDERHLIILMEIAEQKQIKVWTIDKNLIITDINYVHYWNKIHTDCE
jgi:hypothetical protein